MAGGGGTKNMKAYIPRQKVFSSWGTQAAIPSQVIDLGGKMACIVFDGYRDYNHAIHPSPAQAQSASSAIQKCGTWTRKSPWRDMFAGH